MTTQNNIIESMLKYRQKTSVSYVNVYVLKFNSTVVSYLQITHTFTKHSFEVSIHI